MDGIHGFWGYVLVLVPMYVGVTLVGLLILAQWLEDRLSFLQAVFVSGMFSWSIQPALLEIHLRAQTELGTGMYYVLSGVNTALWAVGLVLFFWARSAVTEWWQERRNRRIHAGASGGDA